MVNKAENKPHYPWKLTFKDTTGYTDEEVKKAEELIKRGVFFDGGKARGQFARHEDPNCTWEQISLGYDKSVVTAPYFKSHNGALYVLYTEGYFQPAAQATFDETPRGFANKKPDGTLETVVEATERILKAKLNLPVDISKISRISAPINPDPSWFNIPHGLSMVSYEVSSEYLNFDGIEYSVNKDKLLDPNGRVPKIKEIGAFLSHRQDLESSEKPVCALSHFASLALLYRQK
jgi:hypothetical protein